MGNLLERQVISLSSPFPRLGLGEILQLSDQPHGEVWFTMASPQPLIKETSRSFMAKLHISRTACSAVDLSLGGTTPLHPQGLPTLRTGREIPSVKPGTCGDRWLFSA